MSDSAARCPLNSIKICGALPSKEQTGFYSLEEKKSWFLFTRARFFMTYVEHHCSKWLLYSQLEFCVFQDGLVEEPEVSAGQPGFSSSAIAGTSVLKNKNRFGPSQASCSGRARCMRSSARGKIFCCQPYNKSCRNVRNCVAINWIFASKIKIYFNFV